jgi:hypothetical protein
MDSGHLSLHPYLKGADLSTISPSARILEEKMLRTGWCICQSLDILSSFDYMLASFFARLPRAAGPGVDHTNCSQSKCVGWDSKIEQPTRHRSSHCECRMVSVPTEQVAAIIRKGGLPLISLQKDENDKINVGLFEQKR